MARPHRSRSWRHRGRRGQVAAVATLLGLLLVVTFIANFLTTVVPNQMQINDLNHAVAVEDQVGRLAALLAAAGGHGLVGTQLVQPISLGSDAVAPWAPPDGAAISPGATGSGLTLNFTILTNAYVPPGGWGKTQGTAGSFCTTSPPGPNVTTINCNGASSSTVTYNFTGDSKVYTVKGTGGVAFTVNVSTNNSLVIVSGAGGGSEIIQLIGSHDAVFVTGTGGTTGTVAVVGSFDNVTINASASLLAPLTFAVFIVGNHDTLTVNSAPAKILVTAWGAHDLVNAVPLGANSVYNVYFNGFDPQNPTSPFCPYDDIASTDNVTGGNALGTFHVTFNDTIRSGTATYGFWSALYNPNAVLTCPYFLKIPFGNSGAQAGAFVVNLINTYAPRGQVAFDQGAVVYAQAGGFPVFVEPPGISLSGGALTVWVPAFQGPVGSEAGSGTGILTLRLLSSFGLSLPSPGLLILPGSHVTFHISTPYASAWMSYFKSQPSLAPYVSCSGPASACIGPPNTVGSIGTILLSVPAVSLTLRVAVFSVSLH